jgi:hypothetical protein
MDLRIRVHLFLIALTSLEVASVALYAACPPRGTFSPTAWPFASIKYTCKYEQAGLELTCGCTIASLDPKALSGLIVTVPVTPHSINQFFFEWRKSLFKRK